jgi:hypothetical protein
LAILHKTVVSTRTGFDVANSTSLKIVHTCEIVLQKYLSIKSNVQIQLLPTSRVSYHQRKD